MDRAIMYPGSAPVITDVLFSIRAALIANGNLAQMAFGTATVFDGLAVTPTGPASMSVNVGPGRILYSTVVDSTSYGSLPSDSDAVMKIGINTETTALGPFTAPATPGQSVDIVIEASFSEADSVPVVLPYYNSANPAAPFSGPSNSGTPQNTRRLDTVALNIVVGTPATTGSQTIPSLTAGYVGVAVITIAHTDTTITSGSISAYPGAPAINAKLGATNQGTSNMVVETTGSGTFVVPNGVTILEAIITGAGAGGAGAASGQAGGGGGAGGTAIWLGIVTPGSSITWAVGAGGSGGSAGASGSNGGNSTITIGSTTITGFGGTAGVYSSNPQGGAGGSATNGTDNILGGYGTDGSLNSDTFGGQGGASYWGGGGRASTSGGSASYGQAHGSGGGGTYSTGVTAGTGASGKIVFKW